MSGSDDDVSAEMAMVKQRERSRKQTGSSAYRSASPGGNEGSSTSLPGAHSATGVKQMKSKADATKSRRSRRRERTSKWRDSETAATHDPNVGIGEHTERERSRKPKEGSSKSPRRRRTKKNSKSPTQSRSSSRTKSKSPNPSRSSSRTGDDTNTENPLSVGRGDAEENLANISEDGSFEQAEDEVVTDEEGLANVTEDGPLEQVEHEGEEESLDDFSEDIMSEQEEDEGLGESIDNIEDTDHPNDTNSYNRDLVVAEAVTRDDIENQVRRVVMEEIRQERASANAPVQASIVTFPETYEDDNGNTRSKLNEGSQGQRVNMACIMCCLVASVVCIGAAVGVAIFMSNRNSREQGLKALGTPPTESPTFDFPSTGDSLLDLLIWASPDNGAAVTSDSTPQRQAFLWLKDDRLAAGDTTPSDPTTRSTWLERFAMATLYYSTSGSEWVQDDGWLSQAHVCEWFSNEYVDGPCNSSNQMVILNLGENGLAGELPRELSLLVALSTINLPKNDLTGAIVSDIGNLSNLISLVLNDNRLNGTLPTEIGLLENLLTIDLRNNILRGTVPSTIHNLRDLVVMRMRGNELTGTLPVADSRQNRLEVYDLSDNPFDTVEFSTITDWLHKKNSLLELGLAGTGLYGTLPSDLRRMNLAHFDVRNNALSGTLPDVTWDRVGMSLTRTFITASADVDDNHLVVAPLSLETMHIEDNRFSGTIPDETCAVVIARSALLYADCDQIVCPCCTHCCNENGCYVV